jgi:hypothetical protein
LVKKINGIFAGLMVMILVVAATSVVAASADRTENVSNLNVTKDIDKEITFTLAELAETDLVKLLEYLPEEVLQDLDPADEVTIYLDGKVHINAMMTPGEEVNTFKVHMVWHGDMVVTVADKPSIMLELKNAQLMVQGSIPVDGEEIQDLKVNFHINGEMSTGGVADIDIGTHVLLDIEDGKLNKVKVWIPDLAGLVLIE